MDQQNLNDITATLLDSDTTLTDEQWEEKYRAGMIQRNVQFPSTEIEQHKHINSIPLFQTHEIENEEKSMEHIGLDQIIDTDVTLLERAESFKLSGNECFQLAKQIKSQYEQNKLKLNELQTQLQTDTDNTDLQKQISKLEDVIKQQQTSYPKRLHDAIVYYKQGIDCKANDRLINSQLYINCCKIYYIQQQYRTCLQYAQYIIQQYDKYSIKAYYYCTAACIQMNRYEQAQQYINTYRELVTTKQITNMNYNTEFDKLQHTLDTAIKHEQALQAKQNALKSEKQQQQTQLQKVLQQHNIKLAHDIDTSIFPAQIRIIDNKLILPILLCYAQYTQTDFIQSVYIHDTLYNALQPVFPPQNSYADWDTHKQYTIENLHAYIETPINNTTIDFTHYDTQYELYTDSEQKQCIRVYIPTLQQTLHEIVNNKLLQGIQYQVPGVPMIHIKPTNTTICAQCHTIQSANLFCSQCHKVSYCNVTCQKQHWKQHKQQCKAQK